MSFEAYQIAVKLSLVNGVSSGLLSLSQQFMGLNRHVAQSKDDLAKIEERLHSIKRLGLVGGALAAGGAGMLGMFKGPLESAMEWSREVSRLKQMGLGDSQISDAQKFAQATQIVGTSMKDRMRLFVDAQGAFRESGMGGVEALSAAKVMMPILAKYEVASQLLSGPHKAAVGNAMQNLNKTVDIMGGLTDAARAAKLADGVFKAVQSSGRMVDERQLKQFVAHGSSATNQIDPRILFGGLEPIIGELGGSTTAVGLRTAYTRLNGMMALPPRLMLSEMVRLGMTDRSGRRQLDSLTKLEATDPIAYASSVLEIYAKHGIKSQIDRERENAIFFGPNGSKVYNKIMSQLPVIERSLAAYDKSKGADETIKDNQDSPILAMMKFHKALEDVSLTVGNDLLPKLTPAIQGLAGFAAKMGQFPGLLNALTLGFAGLGTAMAVGGTLTLATAGIKGLSLALGMGGASGGLGLVGAIAPLVAGAGSVGTLVLGLGALAATVAGISWLLGNLGKPEPKSDTAGHENSHWVPGTGRSGAGGHWDPNFRAVPGRGQGYEEWNGSRYIHRATKPTTVQVNTAVHVDGKKVAEAVSTHLAKPMVQGLSASGPDFGLSMPAPGAGL